VGKDKERPDFGSGSTIALPSQYGSTIGLKALLFKSMTYDNGQQKKSI